MGRDRKGRRASNKDGTKESKGDWRRVKMIGLGARVVEDGGGEV